MEDIPIKLYALPAPPMSVVGNNRVGIPIVVLHDAEGAVVEVETKNGEHIRGILFEAEDMMNIYFKSAVILDCQNNTNRKSPQVYPLFNSSMTIQTLEILGKCAITGF